MPNVTAQPRTMGDGKVITEFVDTVGTTTVTYTYSAIQEWICIRNTGDKPITVTVNAVNPTIQPGEKWESQALFTSFSISSTSGVQSFQVWADKLGSEFDSPEGKYFTNNSVTGKDGKRYKVIAGAIRNNAGTWGLISDATHEPINAGSVTVDTNFITLNFGFTAKTIGTLVCVPDETYVTHGISFGSSVGTTQAIITPRIYKQIGGYIYYDGTAWNTSNANGIASAVWSVDKLVITHQDMYQVAPHIYNAHVTGRGGGYVPNLGSVGTTTADVEFFNYTGTKITTPDANMKIYFTKMAAGALLPASINITNSNIWVYGVFEVE